MAGLDLSIVTVTVHQEPIDVTVHQEPIDLRYPIQKGLGNLSFQ
jgi:hypothetical protein